MIERDDTFAREEAKCGMHHTFFWLRTIQNALVRSKSPASDWRDHCYDAVKTGSHEILFTDSVTGVSYRLSITPEI